MSFHVALLMLTTVQCMKASYNISLHKLQVDKDVLDVLKTIALKGKGAAARSD